MAKHLASKASWAAANVTLKTHGGNGFVDQHDARGCPGRARWWDPTCGRHPKVRPNPDE
jgi:hypothetical protein